MSLESSHWNERLRETLERYEEGLLRGVSDKLFKPRSHWPTAELIERSIATIGNAAVVDRRLQAVAETGRRLLAVIGQSRQPRWKLGNVMELLYMLDSEADIRTIRQLLEAGMLYPELPPKGRKLRDFDQWLGFCDGQSAYVFAHPGITARALRFYDGGRGTFAECPRAVPVEQPSVVATDGLEWPLRLFAVWQRVLTSPIRRTQKGTFFKRDHEFFEQSPLLNGPLSECGVTLPHAGLLSVELALAVGLLKEHNGEIAARLEPSVLETSEQSRIVELWLALLSVSNWNPLEGWQVISQEGCRFPSVYLACLLLLAQLPEGHWCEPAALAEWIAQNHPSWKQPSADAQSSDESTDSSKNVKARRVGTSPSPALELAVSRFLLGIAHALQLVLATKSREGNWLVRLSELGEWLLGIRTSINPPPSYPQTLMVQPNLEIVAYRQGLTTPLIAGLSRFATWKTLGSACTLQLEPESVYRALESGWTFERIQQLLNQHGIRETPPSVIESLRTWANKRERLTVYQSATLFEFASAEDLNEAIARGLPAIRLTDRIAVVADEKEVDFRQFRLAGTRDYALPPEQCVVVEEDGVTLAFDMSRSDLLLESEIQRFATPMSDAESGTVRRYRLTQASLAQARERGLSIAYFEEWFLKRTGQPLSPAARLLICGDQLGGLHLKKELVLYVDSAELADGLLQWPQTKDCIERRLGPTAIIVRDENVAPLKEALRSLGLELKC
ncbi:MAG: hypothetical protein KatS3mg105_0564 [Gemmatales bacterium]|nr:MAG: hypothetical protein KatS3mg105_0564 [Gemmatales bacterium]